MKYKFIAIFSLFLILFPQFAISDELKCWITLEENWKNYITPYTEFNIWANGECKIYFRVYGKGKFYYNNEYHECNGSWLVGENLVSFQIRDEKGNAQGLYKIEFYAEDSFGRKSDKKSKIFKVDVTPPETEIGFTGTYFDERWLSSNALIFLNAKDNGCGTRIIKYGIDAKPWKNYENPFKIGEEGKQVIYFYSMDNLGNKENIKSVEIFIDASPPYSWIELHGKHVVNDIIWIRNDTSLSIAAKDNGSGVKNVFYRIDDKWHEYNGTISLKEDGIYFLEFYSIDNVENREKVKSIEIGVDSKPPKIYIEEPKNGLQVFGRRIFLTNIPIIIGGIKHYNKSR